MNKYTCPICKQIHYHTRTPCTEQIKSIFSIATSCNDTLEKEILDLKVDDLYATLQRPNQTLYLRREVDTEALLHAGANSFWEYWVKQLLASHVQGITLVPIQREQTESVVSLNILFRMLLDCQFKCPYCEKVESRYTVTRHIERVYNLGSASPEYYIVCDPGLTKKWHYFNIENNCFIMCHECLTEIICND